MDPRLQTIWLTIKNSIDKGQFFSDENQKKLAQLSKDELKLSSSKQAKLFVNALSLPQLKRLADWLERQERRFYPDEDREAVSLKNLIGAYIKLHEIIENIDYYKRFGVEDRLISDGLGAIGNYETYLKFNSKTKHFLYQTLKTSDIKKLLEACNYTATHPTLITNIKCFFSYPPKRLINKILKLSKSMAQNPIRLQLVNYLNFPKFLWPKIKKDLKKSTVNSSTINTLLNKQPEEFIALIRLFAEKNIALTKQLHILSTVTNLRALYQKYQFAVKDFKITSLLDAYFKLWQLIGKYSAKEPSGCSFFNAKKEHRRVSILNAAIALKAFALGEMKYFDLDKHQTALKATPFLNIMYKNLNTLLLTQKEVEVSQAEEEVYLLSTNSSSSLWSDLTTKHTDMLRQRLSLAKESTSDEESIPLLRAYRH